MKRWMLGVLSLSLLIPNVWAATDTSNSTLSVSPSATAGTTITAADENTRNAAITTWANAHTHKLANSTKFGDGAAGNKALCADAADSVDRCLTWNDTTNIWTIDQSEPGVFNTIETSSGTSAIAANTFLLSGGLGLVTGSGMTVGATLPTVFGDFSARAYHSANQTVTSGSATVLAFNSERWDTDTIHDTAISNSRLTATTTGKYEIRGQVEWAAAGNGSRKLELLLNGTTVIATQSCPFTASAGRNADVVDCTISTHYSLTATNYIELRVTQTVQSGLDVVAASNTSPEFEMVKVP